MVLNHLPAKLKDLSSFSIPCIFGIVSIDRAYSIFKRLGLWELSPTKISLQLADRYIKYPFGILEDVLIKVGDFYVLINFVVLDMAEDSHTQIILGRPFLATALVQDRC